MNEWLARWYANDRNKKLGIGRRKTVLLALNMLIVKWWLDSSLGNDFGESSAYRYLEEHQSLEEENRIEHRCLGWVLTPRDQGEEMVDRNQERGRRARATGKSRIWTDSRDHPFGFEVFTIISIWIMDVNGFLVITIVSFQLYTRDWTRCVTCVLLHCLFF